MIITGATRAGTASKTRRRTSGPGIRSVRGIT